MTVLKDDIISLGRGVGKNYRKSTYWHHVKCCNASLTVVTRLDKKLAKFQSRTI